MTLSENGYLLENNPENKVYRRQDKPIFFARNGAAIYIFNSKDLNSEILNGNIISYEMKRNESVDIDTIEDLELAEILLKHQI